MLKDITGIKLRGANFTSEKNLQLFTKDKPASIPRMALLYGKNGAGKSTIAHAFSVIAGNVEPSIASAKAVSEDNSEITLTSDEQKHIFIFDESYIDNKVRFSGDGLDTIVMLGETGDLEEQLAEATRQLSNATRNYEEHKALCNAFASDLDERSPGFWLKKMGNALRGDNNWAGRDGRIRGRKQATPIRVDETYKQFIDLTPQKSRDQLIVEFEDRFKDLIAAQNGVKAIDAPVNLNHEFNFDETSFIALLKQKIEEPTLSEREKFLLTVLSERKQAHLQDIRSYFSTQENKTCPFCLQPVDEDYKVELFKSIEKILNRAREDHQNALIVYKRDEIVISFDAYSSLNEEAVRRCERTLDAFNSAVRFINEKIDEKIENVYTPIEIAEIGVVEKFQNFLDALSALEDLRIAYNAQASDTAPIEDDLNKINAEIAYYDIKDAYFHYLTQNAACEAAHVAFEQAHKEHSDCLKTVLEIEAQKENISIPLESINRWLCYIFFSDNRLSLEYRDEKYYLKSRGHSVVPNKVSAGERNAIALCYFFSQIMQGKEETALYSEPCFLIIDDPISSFDIENRVGTLSFLKYQLQRFMLGNDETRAIIMTHDIHAFFDIQKFTEEIIASCKLHTAGDPAYTYSHQELFNEELLNFKIKDRQEYTFLLENVFDYAVSGTESLDSVIGNSMRRVLEAYGTFMYKEGIEKVSTSESMDFFDYISRDEKQRTARDVICFIYCLSERHVMAHLKKKANAKAFIEEWLENIRQSSPQS